MKIRSEFEDKDSRIATLYPWTSLTMAARLTNPILPGFSPDPSICCIGDTFFLVNCSFHVLPMLPIYASMDLVSWKHVGMRLTEPLALTGQYQVL